MHNLDEDDHWQEMKRDAQAEADKLAHARRLRGRGANEDGQLHGMQLHDEFERLLGGGDGTGDDGANAKP